MREKQKEEEILMGELEMVDAFLCGSGYLFKGEIFNGDIDKF